MNNLVSGFTACIAMVGMLCLGEAKELKPGSGNGPATVKIGKIDWHVNYDEAMKMAQQQNKPLWLHFGENPG